MLCSTVRLRLAEDLYGIVCWSFEISCHTEKVLGVLSLILIGKRSIKALLKQHNCTFHVFNWVIQIWLFPFSRSVECERVGFITPPCLSKPTPPHGTWLSELTVTTVFEPAPDLVLLELQELQLGLGLAAVWHYKNEEFCFRDLTKNVFFLDAVSSFLNFITFHFGALMLC